MLYNGKELLITSKKDELGVTIGDAKYFKELAEKEKAKKKAEEAAAKVKAEAIAAKKAEVEANAKAEAEYLKTLAAIEAESSSPQE